jgi:enoyl-CoA hydratase
LANDSLLVDVRRGILTLAINRPEQRNALRMDLLDALGRTLAEHADDAAVKCAVVTATGDRCFAAGGDLKELDAIRTPAQAEAMSKRGRRALDQVRRFPLPVVAALNGLALGGGAELAMACDLRIAVPSAEIGFLQGQLNVTTAWGGDIDLVAAVGTGRALELLASARRVGADEAERLGLFDRVCIPDESLGAALDDFLAPYLSRTRRVLEGYKAITTGHRQVMHERLSGVEQRHFVATWTHDDHWDAVASAAARRGSKQSRDPG